MGSISKKKQKQANTVCAKCSEIPGKPTIDHIHEKIDGGNGRPENKQILCFAPCHVQKTNLFWLLRTVNGKKKLTFEESHALNNVYLTGLFDGLLRRKQNDTIMGLLSGKNPAAEFAVIKTKENQRR